MKGTEKFYIKLRLPLQANVERIDLEKGPVKALYLNFESSKKI